MKKRYYLAYGSNMDEEQMALRCPDATLAGTMEIVNYELLFKGSLTGAYATIEHKEGGRVPVLIWEISHADEINLDRYEGYPTFYYKLELVVTVDSKQLTAMVYIMDEKRKIGKPTDQYYHVLEKAYHKFGFDKELLETALEVSIQKGEK